MDSIAHGADAALFPASRLPLYEAAIVGCACRLPGAANEAAFWSLLQRGECSVSEIPADRWSHERFLHPGRGVPGRTYTFAAGVLDNIFGFDAGAFGLSPREAEQIDPQQRLLLELVREAIEDANIPMSALAGENVGVFVGASSLDHSLHFVSDISAADAHFVTGNALSIISNRISHVFGFTGPSLTIDTACSSSLVAFDRAVKAIEHGEIDTAVVAGVNILGSPFNFVGFARAGMLSPTGRCRPFSGDADGYVRAEGGVVTILTRLDRSRATNWTPRAVVMASGTNSDGRTVGISMPESRAQQRLLEELYEQRGIDPDRLAFVEAHGTGTLVGDPAEALAIGTALGIRRSAPLPIGSVKSNIGHLEPASGLAGLLKALNALERRELPASLHLDTLNEYIDFPALNLAPSAKTLRLPPGARVAGISSFGFGGTNAHAVIRLPGALEVTPRDPRASAPVLMLSAQDPQALSDLAEAYADRLEGEPAPEIVAHAAAHARTRLPHRLAISANGPDLPAKLRHIARGTGEGALLRGSVRTTGSNVAFVFTGNGGQYPGMGRVAWQTSPIFRETVEEMDAIFLPLAGWSLATAFREPPDEAALAATEIAQPLIFALEVALARALMASGCTPAAVVGHSVGEIAAAHICGALNLEDAVHLIHWRSQLQARTRGSGVMAFLMASPEQAGALIAEADQSEVVIGAVNAPKGVTLSGPRPAVEAVLRRARSQSVVGKRLGIDYAFHSPAMAPLHEPLLQALADLAPQPPTIPFISGVTGAPVEDAALDAHYWWDNIRQPVHFDAAVRATARDASIGIFLEIGPKAVLTGFLREILADEGRAATVLASLQEKDTPEDAPVERSLLAALVNGAAVDETKLFGAPVPFGRVSLPKTPWHRQPIQPPRTAEALDLIGTGTVTHPLLGTRPHGDGSEWRGTLDVDSRPFLADHKVGGHAVLPATGLAEMALAAGRDTLGTDRLRLEDFAILTALRLSPGESVETRVTLDATGLVSISSRQRGSQEWSFHAQGRVLADSSAASPLATLDTEDAESELETEALYAAASRLGLDYGPAFRLVRVARRTGARIDLDLAATDLPEAPYVLPPTLADAALHGLVLAAQGQPTPAGTAFLPVRFGALTVRGTTTPVRATLNIRRASPRALELDVALFDAADVEIARIESVELRAVALAASVELDSDFRQSYIHLGSGHTDAGARVQAFLDTVEDVPATDDALVLDALAYSIAHRAVAEVAGVERLAAGPLDIDALITEGRLARARRESFIALLDLLAEGSLASYTPEGGCLVQPESDLPAPEPLLHEIALLSPDRAAELAIGARLASGLAAHLSDTAPMAHPTGLTDQWEASSPASRSIAVQAAALVTEMARERTVPLAVMVVERHGIVLDALCRLAETGAITLAVLPADPAARPALADRIRPTPAIALCDEAALPLAELILHVDLRQPLDPAGEFAHQLTGALKPGGALTAWNFALSGFARLMALETPASIATSRRRLRSARAATDVTVITPPESEAPDHQIITAALTALLKEEGRSCLISEAAYIFDPDPSSPMVATNGGLLVWRLAAGEDAASLTGVLDDARTLLEALRTGTSAPALRLFVEGDQLGTSPTAAALWAFGRTAMNEYPDLDIRLVGFDLPQIDDAAMRELTRAVAGLPGERELILDGHGLKAIRLAPAAPTRSTDDTVAARLAMTLPGSLDRLAWQTVPRRAPGPGEVEIAVDATALNFRDVMFAQGLIGDDMLANGFAGPTLGFECAGTVVRVGDGVTGFKPGDPIVGFAPGAFATHVTIPAAALLKVPAGMAPEAAATLPVAFLTAWYGLVHCARLEAGETVLIHGAAGGVGLAAMQIARRRGARIVATAGSPEKRALARLFGADEVYDSRSTAFAEKLRAEGGCDVVLNSLAGRAMEVSLRALKPFGRFVELGKRDFVANTAIGLRPFARNLTYFGVDADQFIAARPALVTGMLAELQRLFEAGELRPLPYRVFAADEARAAFRLMQGSGHVGKILVHPPAHVEAIPAQAPAFAASKDGVHLVVGGSGGFGRETARWLAEHGAKNVVVASRRGLIDPPLEVEGTEITAAALDVRDPQALADLFELLRTRHGRIAGVMHTAMVLDDGLIRDLDATRLAKVLAPKVDGARHLDAATMGLDLDYFVLFSSATTLVGNPGQAAYVAANAYLEGLARRRHAAGHKALAIAWGAISDAGVLARDTATSEKLSRRLGLGMLTAAGALEHLGACLADPRTPPVVVHAPVDWRAARELAVMGGASFAALRPGFDDVTEASGEAGLIALIQGLDDAEARTTVLRLLTGELARILRLPPDSIDPARPLSDIGMDSLMGLELDMEMQRRHKVALPMLGLGAGASLQDVADKVLRKLRPTAAPAGTIPPNSEIQLPDEGARLIDRHLRAGPSAAAIETLQAKVSTEPRRDGSLLR